MVVISSTSSLKVRLTSPATSSASLETLVGSSSNLPRRANQSSCLTRSTARRAAISMSSMLSRTSLLLRRVSGPMVLRKLVLASTAPSRLLKSWATPLASCPSDSIFCRCSSWSSRPSWRVNSNTVEAPTMILSPG